MLTLRDALESALVENPDDLATHYAYADYLQEQGDPRGEFIQIQLALEEPQRSEAERRRLQNRAKELLREHEREWLGVLANDLLPPREELRRAWPWPNHLTEHQFARGWLDSLALRTPTDLVHRTDLGPLLCLASEARLLRKLALDYDDGLVEALLASPSLLNLRIFQLGQPMILGYAPVVQSPLLAELIAKLPRIEELRFFAQGYDAARLFALSNLANLRVLQVYDLNERYPLEVLAASTALGNLTRLLLHPYGACVDLTGVRAIVKSRHLRSLTHLQLHRSDLGDVGCTEIVTSGILKRLKALDLRHGEITDTGALILADCPDLRRLELLDIERNALTQTGIDALRRVLGPALRGDNQQTPEELVQRQYLYEEDFA
ncbi:MAG TPA: TIGR02996 domain-containing protein [Gemmataceae bacterium]|nr:TIGR02996 domain-containing protein [Gemmataceae bacterium]